jgi:hypothetical protein
VDQFATRRHRFHCVVICRQFAEILGGKIHWTRRNLKVAAKLIIHRLVVNRCRNTRLSNLIWTFNHLPDTARKWPDIFLGFRFPCLLIIFDFLGNQVLDAVNPFALSASCEVRLRA